LSQALLYKVWRPATAVVGGGGLPRGVCTRQCKSLNELEIVQCGKRLLRCTNGNDYVFVIQPSDPVSMSKSTETSVQDNPIEAVRRGMRAALRSRFYGKAAAAAAGQAENAQAYVVQLDGKTVHTPARRLLAAPSQALGEAMAAEWEAQRDVINPSKMPLTRLANAIIDGVADKPEPVADEIEKYLASDLLFYRADRPPELIERQAHLWDPVLAWARQTLGADFKLGQGVVHIAQSETALAAARAAIPRNPWRLGAAHAVTTLTGSALIALALAHGFLSAEDAWAAANVDEDWNLEEWGRDELVLERRESRFAEFKAAVMVLASLR
jgi:chaperone required for assembly of F1-ATPase